ncbi:MAG: BamA/TamA family outer membrane protein, partial [Gemmatimonadales bacterium]
MRDFRAGWALQLSLLLGLPAAAADAQTGADSGEVRTTPVAPGEQYDTGWLHRVFFGNHYRDLWSTPVEAPLLDLDSFAGGLKVTKRGGGEQTKSLRLEGADGKEYQFRSIDKDPLAALPPALRSTAAVSIVRDQTSAGHPVGSLLVPPILEAAGVLHAVPRIFILPEDHPRLGEFAEEFGGMLGTIEERPNEEEGAAFEGATEVVGTDKLLKELEDSP